MLDNSKKVKDDIINWIKQYFDNNGSNCTAVVGISGGKDSYIVAGLCVQALGANRVFGVLMPNGIQADLADSQSIVNELGIKHCTINIKDAYDAIVEQLNSSIGTVSKQAMINIAPRLRMTTLYAVGACLPNGARVANTCNGSEDYVGYSTKFGDSAGDFSPLQELLVSEVRQIGYELGLNRKIIDKAPSDGLTGKTDEDNLGFTYSQLENYIRTGTTGECDIDKAILDKHKMNLHKLELMPHFELKEND